MTRSMRNKRTPKTPKRATKTRRAQRPNRNNGPPKPLLPVAVGNNATVSNASKSFRMIGTEYAGQPFSILGVPATGFMVFNKVITPDICPRLGAQSKCWQRYTVNRLSGRLVTLNGSTITSGYTMAFIDDPLFPIRVDNKGIVNLTAFKGSTVQQNWVMSSVSSSTRNGDRPPLFVTPSSDLRLHSPGRVVVQLNGIPSSAAAGESTWALMLEYDITFHTPGVINEVVPGIFEPVWSNTAIINNSPNSRYLQSNSSLVNLRPSTNYYVAIPLPVDALISGTRTVRWCVGFQTGNVASWSSHSAIISDNPGNPYGDEVGLTTVDSLGSHIFFTGTMFTDLRPDYSNDVRLANQKKLPFTEENELAAKLEKLRLQLRSLADRPRSREPSPMPDSRRVLQPDSKQETLA